MAASCSQYAKGRSGYFDVLVHKKVAYVNTPDTERLHTLGLASVKGNYASSFYRDLKSFGANETADNVDQSVASHMVRWSLATLLQYVQRCSEIVFPVWFKIGTQITHAQHYDVRCLPTIHLRESCFMLFTYFSHLFQGYI